ncbi:hypothetical protein BSR28_07540 [Boudabousia liubingyangii]|uniref:VanW family protein n=1 Tax=Boudabousia liubingyangii TaxID=1921764 RepID=UPI000938BB6C|nr:VanW family protein [Boudabousia liubingyangii]OKL46374.1 hypothetical protein BSR28_07540 [Boudabousia liubingyangii]
MDAKTATSTLNEALEKRNSTPLNLKTKQGKSTAISADELDLKVEIEPAIQKLTTFSLNPKLVWAHFMGMGDISLEVKESPKAKETVLKKVETELAQAPQNAQIVIQDGRAQVKAGVNGEKVDANEAWKTLQEAWLSGQKEATVGTQAEAPAISTEAAQKIYQETAEKLFAGPITLQVKDQSVTLEPKELAKFTSFVEEEKDGAKTLVVKYDQSALDELLKEKNPKLLPQPKDAYYVFKSLDAPTLVESQTGQQLDAEALPEELMRAASAEGRKIELKTAEKAPELDTEALKKLGIKEIVAEFSTPYPSEPGRDQNLRVSMERITGKLVKPDEVFSLEAALGPITKEAGFTEAGVISDGMHIDALGGGLSQSCVTTLNAAFFAGLDILEHKPHSQYLRRYPMGRECTLWSGVLDLKVKNNTPHGILFQGFLKDGKMTVRVWSTKYWDVKESTSEKTDIVPPKTEYRTERNCEPSGAGNSGFTVSVDREITHDGKKGKPLHWTWTYKPANQIVCGPKP